ncbi:hypothetical protein ZIOFF_006102 [Zingiber officinale]|uniref:ABC transporter domain-containing protein n=1 Tax=Zingiber officinale TaxID=94328 RepID=A0A8J5HV63_ZINOF|nr:hypothetical protein ZIOFF_006102 [Zingiber officinale]
MEYLREICKCLKTLVNFLLCHCGSLPKHDPKPWDPPFDPLQLKLDPPLAIARRRLPLHCYCSLISLPPCQNLLTADSRGRKKTRESMEENVTLGPTAISYIRTMYAFTNDTLAKYSYATSLQATLRYGILISLVQGLGLGFTYGLDICSCALQLWVGSGLNQAATNFYSFEQGRIAAYRLFEMISRSNYSLNQDGSTLATMQGNIEFRNVYFSYLSRPEIPILSGFYQNVPARKIMALVGRNGFRKSSIIPLMERFYDPTLGEVLLDGENIKHLKLEWLRSQIGLVT